MKMSWEKFLAVALALAILPLTLGGAIPMPSGTTTQAEYISEASGEALGLLSDSDDPVAPGVTEEPEALDPLEGDAKDLAPLGTTDDLVPLGDLVPTSWTDVQSLVTAAQNGDVLKLGGLSTPLANQTITIPAGLTLTIDGGGTNFTNYVAFICAGNNTITIYNLWIISSPSQPSPTLHFASGINNLILEGDNSITNGRGTSVNDLGAAVGVLSGVTLTISGIGSLTATGGNSGAGIGGGYTNSSGTIIIQDTTVTAVGGVNAAGIGGGGGGSAETITIERATVISTGGTGGAGIGGGTSGAGGTITISESTVTAHGTGAGAGIGGGTGGTGGTITIHGYMVQATGGALGAGIGGGGGASGSIPGGSGGTILITGGLIYAEGGSSGAVDMSMGGGAGIGGGGGNYNADSGASGSITISGDAYINASGGNNPYNGGGAGIGSGGAGNGTSTVGAAGDAANPITENTTGRFTATGGTGGGSPAGNGAAIGFGGKAGNPGSSILPGSNVIDLADPTYTSLADIEAAIATALASFTTVYVVNTASSAYGAAASTLSITIPAGKTLVWDADITSAADGSPPLPNTYRLIELAGTGNFEVTDAGLIQTTGIFTMALTLSTAVKVTNAGTVEATGNYGTGVYASDTSTGLSVANALGGSILGSDIGIGLFAGGTVDNTGTIEGTGAASTGIFAQGGLVDITNRAGGTITGVLEGMEIPYGGTIDNYGSITGTGSGSDGIYAHGTAVDITNRAGGIITGASDGINLVSGGSISNSGAITGTGSEGVVNYAPMTLSGTITGTIRGGDAGIFAMGDVTISSGTVTILGDTTAVYLYGSPVPTLTLPSYYTYWTNTLAADPSGPGTTYLGRPSDVPYTVDINHKFVKIAMATPAAPFITTSALPDGAVGMPYSTTLTATSLLPFVWSISNGSLPAGLLLDPIAGVISGTPTVSGTVTFDVKAESGAGYDTVSLTISLLTVYPVLQHFGTWTGTGDAQGIIDAPFGEFIQLKLGSVLIDPVNYTKASGSTIITLKEAYLKTLANGTHTFRAEFVNGYADITLVFNVQSGTTPGESIPNTGDDFGLLASGAVFTLLASGLTALLYTRRRRRLKG